MISVVNHQYNKFHDIFNTLTPRDIHLIFTQEVHTSGAAHLASVAAGAAGPNLETLVAWYCQELQLPGCFWDPLKELAGSGVDTI